MIDESLKDYIRKAAEKESFSHAYIIEGPNRDICLEAAGEIARCMLCEGEKIPCGSCKACMKVKKGIHPDVIEVSPLKDKTTIGVKTIRDISLDAYIIPNEGKKKIYIIKNAESLTEAAQNALLKTIEEPPSYAAFILVIKEGQKLLETVLSRCVSLFAKADTEVIKKKETEAAIQFLKALSGGSEFDFMLKSQSLPKGREQLSEYISTVRKIIRDILITKSKSNAELFFPELKEEISEFCGRFFTEQMVSITDIAGESIRDIDINLNLSLSGMLFFIKCWEEVH